MKALVLLGEGHGDVYALPVLVRKILKEKDPERLLPLDPAVLRYGSSRVLPKAATTPTYNEWVKAVTVAGRRSRGGAVLAIYDGDMASFPLGSSTAFCAGRAAKDLAAAALTAGAGNLFSLAVVFACTEFETWLIASIESLRGRVIGQAGIFISNNATFPPGRPESHGKRWLEEHCSNYRPARDQAPLAELVELQHVRNRKLRSFRRLENAVEQLLNACRSGSHICTP